MSNLLDYEFDVTPIESATKSLIKSFKLSKLLKNILILFLLTAILVILTIIILNYKNKDKEKISWNKFFKNFVE